MIPYTKVLSSLPYILSSLWLEEDTSFLAKEAATDPSFVLRRAVTSPSHSPNDHTFSRALISQSALSLVKAESGM